MPMARGTSATCRVSAFRRIVQSRYMRGRAPRADGVGHRQAWRSDPRASRAGRGCASQGARRPLQPADRRRPPQPSACPTCSRARLLATTTTRSPRRCSRHVAPQRLHDGADDQGMGAISPSTGRHAPDRFIEGTCPPSEGSDHRGDARRRRLLDDEVAHRGECWPRRRRAVPGRGSASSPAAGIEPTFLAIIDTVRLTRLPHPATNSSLVRRTNSDQVKSVSCVSGRRRR